MPLGWDGQARSLWVALWAEAWVIGEQGYCRGGGEWARGQERRGWHDGRSRGAEKQRIALASGFGLRR